MDGGWRKAADFFWSMVTKEGKGEGNLRGMKEFYTGGIDRCKITKREMWDLFKCQIHADDWFCSLAEAFGADENKSLRLQDELFLEPQTRTPNSQTQIS